MTEPLSVEEFLKQEDFEEGDELSDETEVMTLEALINEDVPGVNADNTPLPTPRVDPSQSPRFGSIPGFDVVGTGGVIQRAADAGVIYDKSAPDGHFVASFAVNDENRLLAYKNAMPGTHVRMGPITRKPEYFDTETGRWALVNAPGIGGEDAKLLAGPAIAIGLEATVTAAALGAGAIPGGQVGSAILFSGVNTGSAVIGEGVRLYLGQRMGINNNLDPTAVGAHLALIGGGAGIFGVAGAKGTEAAVGFWRWLGLDVSTKQLVRKYGMDLEHAAAIQDAINRELASSEFVLSLGQAGNVEEVLAFEKLMSKNIAFASQMSDQSKQQRAALRTFFNKINEPYVTGSAGHPRRAGEAVQRVAGRRVAAKEAEQNMLVEVRQAELDRMVMSLHDAPEEALGTPLRGFVNKEVEALDTWADEVMYEFNEAVGNVRVRPVGMAELADRLDKKAKDALFDFQNTEIRTIIGERKLAEAGGDMNLALKDGGILEWESQANEVATGIWNPESQLTVDQVWSALKSMKRMKRRANIPGAEAMDGKVLDEVIDTLQNDLRVALREAGGGLEAAYDTFIQRYATETTRLKRGIIGDIMAYDDVTKRYLVEDGRVFHEIFTKQKGLIDPADQVIAAIGNDPVSMDVMRGAINRNWKESVFNDKGEFLQRAHDKWIDNYGKSAQKFLSKEEYEALVSGKGLARALEQRIARRDQAFKELNKGLDAEIYGYRRPDFVVRDMLVPDNEVFAEEVRRMLTTGDFADAEAWGMVQDAARRKVVEMVTLTRGPDGFEFSLDALNKMLHKEGKSIQPNLRIIMGDEYVDNLLALNEAMTMMSRRSVALENPSGTAGASANVKAMNDLLRAWVGLFTTPGRVLTAANRVRGRSANKLLIQSIANPGDLRQLMALANEPITSPKWQKYLSTLGATGLMVEYFDTPTTGPADDE